jgi:hypothetical protein
VTYDRERQCGAQDRAGENGFPSLHGYLCRAEQAV